MKGNVYKNRDNYRFIMKKKELYKKLEKLRRDQNREAAKIIERCHAMEQATREALNSLVDEKRKRGINF